MKGTRPLDNNEIRLVSACLGNEIRVARRYTEVVKYAFFLLTK